MSLLGYTNMTFSWLTSFVRLGALRPMSLADIGDLDPVDKAGHQNDAFARSFSTQLAAARDARLARGPAASKRTDGSPLSAAEAHALDVAALSMWQVVVRAFGLPWMVFAGLCMGLADICAFVSPSE